MKIKNVISAVCLFTVGAVFAEATISDVQLRQRWPWSRLVDVYYTVSGAEGDVSVKPSFTTRGDVPVATPDSTIAGERLYVGNGRHHFMWNPADSLYADRTLFADLKVALEIVPNPLYMIVDFSTKRGATNAVTTLTEAELRSGAWGDWEERGDTVIWTGVTNALAYKQQKLVLRYIPAGSFTIGAPTGTPNATAATDASETAVWNVAKTQPQGDVTLTRGYWLGVFETTIWQWEHVLNSTSWAQYTNADKTMPQEGHEWSSIRGSNYNGAKWPQAGHTVLSGTFMSNLRSKTGLQFDLPTEAQWDFAARAGFSGLRYGALSEIACAGSTEGPAVVGSFRPNDWGLYDMLGNVREGTLSAGTGSGIASYRAGDFGTDPVGAVEGDPYRVVRGGGWCDGPAGVNHYVREQCAWAANYDTNKRRYSEGFRVWLPLD